MQENVAQRTVLLVLAAFVVLWTVVPSLLHTALPLDVVESSSWGRELVLFSYKHPNLPGLLLEASYRLTGQYGWPQYLLSALFGAATIWFVFALGRALFGTAGGAAGALLLLGCFYFTWPIPEFNHNVAQLPIWAAIALLLWLAVRDNRLWQWLLLGLVAGIGLYAKLSTLSLIAAGGIWLLVDGGARSRLGEYRAWLGLAVFAVLAGIMGWHVLADNGGGMVTFIGQSGADGGGPLNFVAAQVANLIPMLIVLAIALLLPRKRDANVIEGRVDRGRARLYLAVLVVVPLLSAVIAAASTGAQDMWGAPMLNLSGLLLVAWAPSRFDNTAMRRVFVSSLMLLVLAVGSFGARYLVTLNTAASPIRTQWPQQAIATRLDEIWRENTGNAELKIVAGDGWVSGLVALAVDPRASVFKHLDPTLSPWVDPADARREGMLVVWPGEEVPLYAADLVATNVHGVEDFAWSRSDAAKPIRIGYVVVAPAAQ